MREGARCGWYVFVVENGEGRELTEQEDQVVNSPRFGGWEARLVQVGPRLPRSEWF